MHPIDSSSSGQDEMRFAQLVSQFHHARSDEERRLIANEYACLVFQLIESGSWDQAPSWENWLPDEWMPQAFFDYWMN